MPDKNRKYDEESGREERKVNTSKPGKWVIGYIILVIVAARIEVKIGKNPIPISGISLCLFAVILNEWFTKKKLLTGLTVITSTIIVVWIVFGLWGGVILKAIFHRPPEEYELTAQEQKLLLDEWPKSEETIKEGKLYKHHVHLLNEIREGMSYLEEKYPGYQFRIDYRDDWAVTIIDYWVTEETTGERFKLRFDKSEGDGLQPEDDFYIYFIEDAYQEYLEEQFMQRSDKVTEVTVSITRTRGEGYDDKITMADIIGGKLDLAPRIHVYVLAGEMSEIWCEQYAETKMQKAIEEINLSGTYVIDFYVFPEGVEQAEENKEFIDYSVFRWDREGENDG